MRTYQYMMAQFTFYDRTGICRMLEEKAEKGWLLDKVTNYAWRFRRIQPRRIHYAVTYFPKASAYDPHPSEQQQELFEFCAHSGWILAGTTAQMQIFYNEAENPVPIETDPVMELENIHRSAKENYLPAYFMLLILAVFQIGLQISQLFSFPLTYLSQDTTVFNWLCETILFAMCALEIGGYFHWYRRAKPAAEAGEFVETRGSRRIQLFLLGVIIVALIWLLCTMRPRMGAVMGIALVMLFAIIICVMSIQTLMKRKGVPTGINRTVTIVLTVVLTMVVTGLIIPVTGWMMELPVWEENREVAQHEWNGLHFSIYKDDIPLRVEDLADVSSPDYSYEANEQGSILLQKGDYSQIIWGSSEFPELSYIVYTTKIPAIYTLCMREATKSMDYPIGADSEGNLYYDSYVPQEPAVWGAEGVYRRYANGEPYLNHYVLCYENKVVILQPDWEITEEQKAVVGKILGK